MPGMRKLWDPRTEQGCMLQRFSRNEVLFYAVTKGKRFIASPRDIVGVQKDYVERDGSCMIVQKSVETDVAPEQAGMRRATLDLSGWHFEPQGEDLKVTYIFRIGLGGMIPNALVSMATTETPLCTGRARDTFYEYGYAPYIRHTPDEPSTIFQKETFKSPPIREYQCTVTTGQQIGETFEIAYDLRRMYRPEGGVQVAVKGEGVQAVDDGKGTVRVQTTESGKTATVVLTPR
ncbi:RHTO0S04e03422g1_1 [Rhodotorula toruloides]|uniref:RHTO0S04e03422g1_1 n=2 Tax=Rhodotorula toruloides TaxID=5286 RepID=A0A061AX28_RHOTO|nr:RHTO0S04e03422g1_1 [Rhodotorula toruloides]